MKMFQLLNISMIKICWMHLNKIKIINNIFDLFLFLYFGFIDYFVEKFFLVIV